MGYGSAASVVRQGRGYGKLGDHTQALLFSHRQLFFKPTRQVDRRNKNHHNDANGHKITGCKDGNGGGNRSACVLR